MGSRGVMFMLRPVSVNSAPVLWRTPVTGDIHGEARIVERAFGLGASALAEVVQLLGNRLKHQAA